MSSILNNLINGNLTDAKKQAVRFGLFPLAQFFRENADMTRNKAIMAASYLKGRCTFQAYCDAE